VPFSTEGKQMIFEIGFSASEIATSPKGLLCVST